MFNKVSRHLPSPYHPQPLPWCDALLLIAGGEMQHFPKFPTTPDALIRWFCFSSWFKSQDNWNKKEGISQASAAAAEISRNKNKSSGWNGIRVLIGSWWWRMSVFLRYHAGNWRIYGEWNFRCLRLWKMQQTKESRDLPKVSLQQRVYTSAFSTLNSCQGGKKTYLLTSGICNGFFLPMLKQKTNEEMASHAT